MVLVVIVLYCRVSQFPTFFLKGPSRSISSHLPALAPPTTMSTVFTANTKRGRQCVFAVDEASIRVVAHKLNNVPENIEIVGPRCTRVVAFSSRKNANFSVVKTHNGSWRAGKMFEHPVDELPKVRWMPEYAQLLLDYCVL